VLFVCTSVVVTLYKDGKIKHITHSKQKRFVFVMYIEVKFKVSRSNKILYNPIV
jgi:hypothetical protein